MTHPFRRKWGQNFLRDPNYIRKILTELNPQPEDTVLEIGPGDGALTFALAPLVSTIHAVEIDPLLVKQLKRTAPKNIHVIEEDILNFDLDSLTGDFLILGNLPYYLTTPIIFKVINNDRWARAVLMVQQEVGARITSPPGNRIYGRLSVMVQTYTAVNSHFKVPSTVFQPKPKVDSVVISLRPRSNHISNREYHHDIVKLAFSQRRKKLKNTLGDHLNPGLLEIYGDQRPEQLSADDFMVISENNPVG
ncbi:MAG: ribosomal RNA small subunit methyltransferase A [FCB group bacterium]|nr:ribosomal RNA small subunit methyltransferase A [FCB group bacterium]